MMEAAKAKRRRNLLSTIFHILHVCISIGLVIAVVRNQLVNESRFERLESNCKCHSKEEVKSMTQDKFDVTTAHPLAKRTLDDQPNHSSQNEHSYNDTEIPKLDPMNRSSLTNKTNMNEEEASSSSTISTLPNILKSFIEGNEAEQVESKQNSSSEYKMISEVLRKEARQLFSCLDKLKTILETQITTANTDSKINNGCRLLRGLKGDPGEPGEPGQKGSMGPRGCSGTSFAYPSIASSPRRLVVKEGKPAVLSCNATANPQAQITWYRDNVMLTGSRDNSSNRYAVHNEVIVSNLGFSRAKICPGEVSHPVTQSTLVIKQSRGSDSGTYACKARNMMGVVSKETQVLVQVYVLCSITPSSTTVVQGNDVKLSCRASGVPTPETTWYRKDGSPMPNRYNITGGDLHIYNISKKEEGAFVCLATNLLGSKTTESTITVNMYPKITSFVDQPITINESQTLVLPCNATGYPGPEIEWSKVNDSLPEGRCVYDSQMLNISRVQYEDRGEYVCTANNTVGSSAKKVTVNIQVGPKITKRPNSTEYGYRGKSKILLFEIFAYPNANITWRRPNKEKVKHGRFNQMKGSLVIHNLKYTDSGHYQVTARNKLGEVKLTTFLVVRDAVPAAIRSVQSQETLSIIEGRNLTKACNAVGVPTPEIIWTHEGNKTISARTLSLPLNIVNVGSQHAGRYTCTARNQFGFEQQHFDVKLLPRWVKVGETYSYYYGRRPKRYRWSGEIMSSQFSRGRKYSNGLNQYWRLTSNTRIAIYFKVFSTELCCDKVRIYDGRSASSPLLGEFSGNVLPPNITSSSTQLYVTFTTDDSKPDTGFLAEYKSVY